MNDSAPSHALLLDRFAKYEARSADGARHNARGMFPELRGFSFLDSATPYLKSNSLHLDGWRFGVVASSGHRIRLNDEGRYCLLMPFEGRITVDKGDREAFAEPGQLLNVRPGERRTTVGPDYRGAVVLIPRVALRARAAMMEPAAPSAIVDGAVDGMEYRDHGGLYGQALRRQLLFMLEELDRSDAYFQSERLKRSALSLLADLVVERWLHIGAEVRGEAEPAAASLRQVRKAEDFIRGMLSEPISIGDIAAHIGVSARALQSAFRKLRGTTPYGFLTARRMELVHARLVDAAPGQTVTSIILDCGIANPGRFAGLYKRAYGELPSETLRRGRAGSDGGGTSTRCANRTSATANG